MSKTRDELVDGMDALLTGSTFSEGIEALLDVLAALIIEAAPDRVTADRTTVAAARGLGERVEAAWDQVRAAMAADAASGRLH